jgi:hypothetical protein
MGTAISEEGVAFVFRIEKAGSCETVVTVYIAA